MEQNVVDIKSFILRWGLYMGLAVVGFSVLVFVAGLTYTESKAVGFIISALNFALAILFICLAIKSFKSANEGYLSLGEALKIGVGVALLASIISGIYQVVFVNYIDPNYAEKVMEVAMMQNPDMTDAQLELMEKIMYPSAWKIIGGSLLSGLFGGFIISLIAGAIMQHKRPMTF